MNAANVLLNLCVRCGGPMDFHRDHYGDYLRCLQCGQHRLLTGVAVAKDGNQAKEGNGYRFSDRGCAVSKTCLACPLPDCKWE